MGEDHRGRAELRLILDRLTQQPPQFPKLPLVLRARRRKNVLLPLS